MEKDEEITIEKLKAKKMLKIGYVLLGIFILVIVLYIARFFVPFALIHLYEKQEAEKREEEIAKIVPYSQRGLPLPATDVPVVLPPDPGEAGKATLAGIDSNNDGVRDDLEREIVYMYPQNEEVRRVLRAMVKTGQQVITTEGDHDHFERLMVRYFDFKDCYRILVFGPRLEGYNSTNTNILWYMLQNTKERKKHFATNNEKGKPYTTSAGSVYACKNLEGQY